MAIPHWWLLLGLIGDLATLGKAGKGPELPPPRLGPCGVTKHHGGGTVTIQKAPYATDRVNLWRLKPYQQPGLGGWMGNQQQHGGACNTLAQPLAKGTLGTGLVWGEDPESPLE